MSSLSQEEKLILATRALQDPVFFCKSFLGELFERPIPWPHRGILSVLTKQTKFLVKYGELYKIVSNFVVGEELKPLFSVYRNDQLLSLDELKFEDEKKPKDREDLRIVLNAGRNNLILMPRGSAKTTLAGMAIPLRNVLYQVEPFTLYVSSAQLHSQGQLESVKRQLGTNELVLEVFGDLKPRRSDDERWSADLFETMSGIAVAARGKGGQIRGINHRNRRPSKMIVDDLQSREDCISEVQRNKDLEWAFGEFKPARSQLKGQEGTIDALGTKIHKHCIVNTWAKDPTWTVVELGAMDRDGDPIWADYMDKAKYEAEKRSYQSAGLKHLFHLEYDNKEVSEESQLFTSDMFQYGELSDGEQLVAQATFCDPAVSEKRTADFSAIATVGLTSKRRWFILDIWMERTSDEERKAAEFIRQCRMWRVRRSGWESNAYQAAFGTTLKEQMYRQGYFVEIIPVLHKTKKAQRIRGALRPRFANKQIWFRKRWQELELQLEDFRMDLSHDHDDGPDAVAAAFSLLDPVLGSVYEIEPDATVNLSFDEIHGDWRWAS